MTLRIHDVTDDQGAVVAPMWLARAEGVHRQLRDRLAGDYGAKMRRVFAQGGRMCVAARGEEVAGVAVYRLYENTHDGVKFYVDDLVTGSAVRSTGVGRALLAHLQAQARRLGATSFTLDSGTQRHRAHAFYFREGMSVVGFAFRKPL